MRNTQRLESDGMASATATKSTIRGTKRNPGQNKRKETRTITATQISKASKKLAAASANGRQMDPQDKTLGTCATDEETKHFTAHVKLHGRQITAMIDSGAQGNFISPRTVNEHRIPWKAKKQPYKLRTAEGELFSYGGGTIDLETDQLEIELHHHYERITFDLMDLAGHEIILGIPWLRRSNPRIDWITGQISWKTMTPRWDSTIGRKNSNVDELKQLGATDLASEGKQDDTSSKSFTQPEFKSREDHQQLQNSAEDSELPEIHKPNTEDQTNMTTSTSKDHTPGHLQDEKQKECSKTKRKKEKGNTGQKLGRPQRTSERRENQEKRFFMLVKDKSTDDREIPEEYRQYEKLFRTGAEMGLPQHSEWDHEIPLREGTQPRFHKIYNLNEEQLKALRVY